MMVAGAVMITAVSRCRISTCAINTYAAMMAPETCAMPLTMMVNSSDSVSPARNGRMVSGASVWPMKMLAATLVDSAPLAPITRCITTAMALHQHLHHAQVIKDREQAADENDDRQNLKREDGRLAAAQLVAENELAAGLRIADDRIHLVADHLERAAPRAFAAR